MKVKSVERLPQSSESLYDLSVEKTHTYTVGESKVVVHNCGVGFRPIIGILNGFMRPIPHIEIIRSTRTQKGGAERNTETWLSASKTWILQVGDSAEAWAKAVGKLISGKHPAEKLIIDLSQIRPAGERLRGYGWISSGDHQLYIALQGICTIMNRAAGRLLSELDILDIVNWMGTILSSRRSAELALMPNSNKYWREFALAKRDHQQLNPQRGQSNNSLVFYDKPSKSQLFEVFDLMLDGGGSEPGIVNGDAALRRAPYFYGMNPCLAKDSLVCIPDKGLVRIGSLSGTWADVIDGSGDVVLAKFEKTGDAEALYEVEFSNGMVEYATKYHRFVKIDGSFITVGELQLDDQLAPSFIEGCFGSVHDPDNAYLDAWLIADGTWYNSKENSKIGINLNTKKRDYIEELTRVGLKFSQRSENLVVGRILGHAVPDKSKVPDYVLGGTLPTILAFIRGYLESDGHFSGDAERGYLIQFTSIHRTFLNEFAQLCRLIGVRGKISLTHPAGEKEMPDGKGGYKAYPTKDVYRFTISNPNKLLQYLEPQLLKRQPYNKMEVLRVVRVELTDRIEPVFCAGVPTTQSFLLGSVVSGNCGEILLGDKGFCVHGDTWLITREALVKISDVVGEEVEVWNGQQWAVVVPQITGYHQQMLRIELSDGSYLDCTPYHRLSVTTRFSDHYHEVMAKTVMEHPGKYAVHSEPFKMVNDSGVYVELAYELGFGYGDGYEEKDDVVILLYGRKVGLSLRGVQYQGQYRQNPDVPQRKVVLKDTKLPTIDEVFLWDRTSCLAFIAGLADSDGSNTESGGIRIYQSDEVFIRKLQLLLSKNGIRSSVCLMADVGQSSNFKRTKASWYVSITDVSELPCQRLNTKLGHAPIGKGKYQNIKRIYPLEGEYTSYCFEEPIQHKAVFNNMLTYQCNLCEVVLPRFNGNMEGLKRAVYLIARANYRQSCVNLDDGLLQRTWHELNEYLHLCGVGLTGIVQWEFANEPSAFDVLHQCAKNGANSMADELDMEHPAAVTTTKPSGTLSKLADCTEGIHKPLGRYILNNINYSIHDPVVKLLQDAGYRTFINPYDATGILVTFPVQFANVEFSEVGSRFLNLESAVAQLERYKMVMEHYIDHNVSSTVSYSPGEIGSIVDWIHKNWDCYVSATFMLRNDPTKTAEDLGYPYLPQEVVTQEVFEAYANTLQPIDMEKVLGDFDVESAECAGGMCPIR